MIFPDKPRPPWQYSKPQLKVKTQSKLENKTKIVEPKPPGYWRERIEFFLIIVGLVFWIQYWSQISLK
jgi:hypothetical protein